MRSRTTVPPPATAVLTGVCVLVLAVSGCGGSDEHRRLRRQVQPDDTGSPAQVAAGTGGLRSRLLTDSQWPQEHGRHWRLGRTGPPEPDAPFGPCARSPLSSIGAERVVQRTLLGPYGVGAAEQLGLFPSPRSARRAERRVREWHSHCRRHSALPDRITRVSAPRAQHLPQGDGWWHTVMTTGGDQPPRHDFAVVVRGRRLALLRLVSYDHVPAHASGGPESIAVALHRAASRMGSDVRRGREGDAS